MRIRQHDWFWAIMAHGRNREFGYDPYNSAMFRATWVRK